MTKWKWYFQFSSIVLVVALTWSVLVWLPDGSESQEAPQLYQGVPFDANLLALDRRALDEAYHAQILKLFGVWLSEGAKDPRFFTNGLQIARRAYSQAAQQIAKREQQVLEQEKKP